MKTSFLKIVFVLLVALSASPSQASDCARCVTDPGGGPGDCYWDATRGHLNCIPASTSGCLMSDPCGYAGGGCFLAGTLVSTDHGLTPIEELKVGDRVVASADGHYELVTRVYRAVHLEYWTVNDDVSVTGTHPFFTQRGWIECANLEVGDKLIAADGEAVSVASIEARTKGVRVYNIEVSGSHTFYANGFLVHNKEPDPEG